MSQNTRSIHNPKNKHAETKIKSIMPLIIILKEKKYLGIIVKKTCVGCV